jgi:hypothetical protein
MRGIGIGIAVVLLVVAPGFAADNEKQPDTMDYTIDAANRSDTTSGNIDGSQTFDRRFLVTYDGTCSAASSDSSNDGVGYEVFPFYSPAGQAVDAEVVLGTLSDSVMFVYCDPFDPANPDLNLLAWDDDGGVGLGSAMTPADGYMLDPFTQYYMVISGYSSASSGDYTLNLGGDLVFGQPTPYEAPEAGIPTLSTVGVGLFLLALAGAAVLFLRRR